ncbi:MAG: hypothetical protein QXG39_02795 [Candidatus Aenigmatarchaeota archaeon]
MKLLRRIMRFFGYELYLLESSDEKFSDKYKWIRDLTAFANKIDSYFSRKYGYRGCLEISDEEFVYVIEEDFLRAKRVPEVNFGEIFLVRLLQWLDSHEDFIIETHGNLPDGFPLSKDKVVSFFIALFASSKGLFHFGNKANELSLDFVEDSFSFSVHFYFIKNTPTIAGISHSEVNFIAVLPRSSKGVHQMGQISTDSLA